MATKILGSNGLKRMRDAYFRNDGFQEHKQIDAWLEHNAVVKEGYENGTYKMKDLYPDTYATMTSVPDGLDVSKLRIASFQISRSAEWSALERYSVILMYAL